jgi:hypothetical protein
MMVFTCTNFLGIGGSGGGQCALVVVAVDGVQAAIDLIPMLEHRGLPQDDDWVPELIMVYTDFPSVSILATGD